MLRKTNHSVEHKDHQVSMRSTKEESRKLEDCACRWRGDFFNKICPDS